MWPLIRYYFPKWYLLSLAGVLLLVFLWGFSHIEAYFYPYPAIDTQFSKDYTEAKFKRITRGMTEDKLTQLMGEPLSKEGQEGGLANWRYSKDDKCSWGDFAWLGREVELRNGKVVNITKSIYYD